MTLINERVQHIIFGLGVIKEEKDSKIWVQFNHDIGTKTFLCPEAFEKFLKAVNPVAQSYILEECHRKQQEIEQQRIEKEHAAQLEEKAKKLPPAKKKLATKTTKKKASS